MSKKTYYTLDDLYEFCRNNKFEKFSSATMGAPLVVQTYGTFESIDNISEGLMPVKLKSCHTGRNLNKSSITDDVMNECKASFCGRPILGAIYKTDSGEYEFRGHDMEITEEGNIEYIEQPIGVVSQTEIPYLEYDKDEDKNYLMVSGTIFAEYSHASEILQRRGKCSCSVELAIDELSYDTKEGCLSIDKFRFMGVTILGYQQDGVTEVKPGMAGSNITIEDFSKESNSMFTINHQDKLVDVLEKLNTTLEQFNINSQKGDEVKMNKFEELLQKYNKTAEEIDFSVENLTDEELEAKFAEVFGESASTKEDDGEVIVEDESKEDSSEDETDDDSTEAIEENMGCKKKKKKCSVDENGDMNLVYEISHDDIRFALYNLLIPLEEIDNDYYFIWNVYDNYFIYENWDNTKCYKQEYTVDSDVVAFSGERIEMFKELLTASEKAALEDMRSNYSALVEFKATTEANELQAKKDAVFAQAEYDAVRETKSFKKLIESAKELTVEECEVKAKDILDDFATYAQNFSAQDSQKPTKTLSFNFDVPEKKKSAYGNLFN